MLLARRGRGFGKIGNSRLSGFYEAERILLLKSGTAMGNAYALVAATTMVYKPRVGRKNCSSTMGKAKVSGILKLINTV